MISQDRENTVRRPEAPYQLGTWCGVAAIMRDVVAGQRDQVRAQVVCRLNSTLEMTGINLGAVVEV